MDKNLFRIGIEKTPQWAKDRKSTVRFGSVRFLPLPVPVPLVRFIFPVPPVPVPKKKMKIFFMFFLFFSWEGCINLLGLDLRGPQGLIGPQGLMAPQGTHGSLLNVDAKYVAREAKK